MRRKRGPAQSWLGGTQNPVRWAHRIRGWMQAGIFVDRSASGRFTNTSIQGGPICLPARGVPLESLQLQVFLDRCAQAPL